MHAHGHALVEDSPVYLREIALVRSLRFSVHWCANRRSTAPENDPSEIFASDFRAITHLGNWMRESPLRMRSVAASTLILGAGTRATKDETRLFANPYTLPSSVAQAADLKGPHGLLLGLTEQFRRYGLDRLNEEVRSRLSCVPPTATEVKELLRNHTKKNEQETIQQLMPKESESAWSICRLRVTRPIAQAALDELRENRAAQANFARILAATRFKYASREGLVPAKCPDVRGNADNYLHLLECYKLQRLESRWPKVLNL